MNQTVSIMQPTYLPWAGYFELIDRSETFIFLDDVQFNRQSWQQRNKIKTPDGPIWLTVPVRKTGRREQLISEVEITNEQPWRRKHYKSIKFNYMKAPFWDEYSGFFEDVYHEREWSRLVNLNIFLIKKLCQYLGIDSTFHRSSSLPVEHDGRTDVTVTICSYLEADKFLSPIGALEFHKEDDLFSKVETQVRYQRFEHPEYTQLHGDFESHLSAIDLLLNKGDESLTIIRGGSSSPYSPEEALSDSDL